MRTSRPFENPAATALLAAAFFASAGCSPADTLNSGAPVAGDPTTNLDGGSVSASNPDGAMPDAGPDPRQAPLPVPPSGMQMGATMVDGGVEFRVWAPHAM